MITISEGIRGVMQVDPAADAIEFDGAWWSWGDLTRLIVDLDAALDEAGLERDTRVGAILRNRPQMAACLLGVVTADRCVVTLNPSLPDGRLAADILALKPPVLVAVSDDWARPAVVEAARTLGCLGVELTDDRMKPLRLVPGLERIGGSDFRRAADAGVAVEMMTSGTTGVPKRVPLRRKSLEQAVIDAGVFDNRKAGDPPMLRGGVQIFNNALAHIAGVFGLFNAIMSGRKLALLERFRVEDWVDLIKRHRPKVASAPPAAIRMILDADVPKEDLSSLVALRAGTAPLDLELEDAFMARYGIPILQNYSATEFAGAGAGWTLEDHRRYHAQKRGSVGRVTPGLEARIVDPETRAPLPFGQQGLLEIRGPNLSGGTWMRTTDLAVLDEDNFLWIKGRADNVIIRGGFKVFPEDIIRALDQHPAILEAAVVSLPDARLGQVPAAAYKIRSDADAPTEDELRAFLKEKLLPYQVPVILRRLDELPRTPSLKVSQPELKKLLEADLRR